MEDTGFSVEFLVALLRITSTVGSVQKNTFWERYQHDGEWLPNLEVTEKDGVAKECLFKASVSPEAQIWYMGQYSDMSDQ